MADKFDVASPSPGYEAMAKRWPLLDTLLGGTPAMRAAGSLYLPPHRKEEASKYQDRLRSSVLLPAYESALDMAVSRPFAKPVTYSGDLPPGLDDFWNWADDNGRSMTLVARDLFYWGLHHGHCHVLVDNPANVGTNQRQQRQLGVSPQAIVIKAPQLFGWRYRRGDRGLELDQIRFFEHRVTPVGDYGEKPETTIKVIQRATADGPGWWRRFKQVDDGAWVAVEEGAYELDRIPLVTWYGERIGRLMSRPPFETVAHMNVQHWQSDSSQHDLLQFARVGVWFAKGWDKKELDAGLTIGAHRFTGSTNPEADLRVVEHSGAAIKAGADSIEVLERRMREAAHDVITRAPTQPMAATTSILGEQRHESQIGAWVSELNHAIYEIVEFAADWIGQELPDNFAPQVFSDFVVGLRGDGDVPSLHQMRANGDLSRITYYKELQRRGFLSESVVAEEEEERIAAELLTMARSAPPPPAPETPTDADEDGPAKPAPEPEVSAA